MTICQIYFFLIITDITSDGMDKIKAAESDILKKIVYRIGAPLGKE